jgi:hypothetical protein
MFLKLLQVALEPIFCKLVDSDWFNFPPMRISMLDHFLTAYQIFEALARKYGLNIRFGYLAVKIKNFHIEFCCLLSIFPPGELTPDLLACEKIELDLTAETLVSPDNLLTQISHS